MMNSCSNQYKISNELSLLGDTIESAILFIKSNAGTNLADELFLRIRWILTELSTNVYKHSSSKDAMLKIMVSEGRVALCISDDGNVFDINSFQNEKAIHVPGNGLQKIKLCDYGLLTLHAQFTHKHHLLFLTEETNNNISIDSLNEHYGLLIITRSCDEFTYSYYEETDKNEFIAVLKY